MALDRFWGRDVPGPGSSAVNPTAPAVPPPRRPGRRHHARPRPGRVKRQVRHHPGLRSPDFLAQSSRLRTYLHATGHSPGVRLWAWRGLASCRCAQSVAGQRADAYFGTTGVSGATTTVRDHGRHLRGLPRGTRPRAVAERARRPPRRDRAVNGQAQRGSGRGAHRRLRSGAHARHLRRSLRRHRHASRPRR